MLVLGLSQACSKRPVAFPEPSVPRGLEECLRYSNSSHPKDTYHIVQAGETLYRISKSYGTSPEEIAGINGITDITRLSVGQRILIPGYRPSALKVWPVFGKISSGFGKRGFKRFHSGIDIPAPTGTSIRAVGDGLVVLSGKSLDGYSGYGKIVIIEHGSGIETVYAHNRRNHVKAGDCVRVGEIIAEIGSSGNATGPHVHFEVRNQGKPVNPLKYLP